METRHKASHHDSRVLSPIKVYLGVITRKLKGITFLFSLAAVAHANIFDITMTSNVLSVLLDYYLFTITEVYFSVLGHAQLTFSTKLDFCSCPLIYITNVSDI